MNKSEYVYEFFGGPQDGRTQTFGRQLRYGVYVVFQDCSEYQYNDIDSDFKFVGYRDDLTPRGDDYEIKLRWHHINWWPIVAGVTLIGLAVWKACDLVIGVVSAAWHTIAT